MRKPPTPEQLKKRAEKREERRKERVRHYREYMERFSPCPFCGSKDLEWQYNGMKTDWVRCLACDATGPVADGENESIKLWNQRKV